MKIALLILILLPGCGVHYDCYNLNKYTHDVNLTMKAIEYCHSDRMWTYHTGSCRFEWDRSKRYNCGDK